MSSTPADAGRRFRPRLWPTLATLVGLAVSGRPGHLAAAAAGLEGRPDRRMRQRSWRQPAMPLPPGAARRDWTFAGCPRVAPICTMRPSPSALTAFDGQPGGRLVTPLRLDDGRMILVDRGWLPQSLLPPNTPPDLQPAGPVALEGIARWRGDFARGWMAPADSPAQRRWFNWDIPAHGGGAGPAARAARAGPGAVRWAGRPAPRPSGSRSISPTTI